MAVMAPRSKKSPAAKPQSGHSVLQSVRRMHNHLGILMVPFTLLSQVMKGLKRRFVERHGHEALLANRKRPLFYKHLVSLLAVSSVLLPGGVMWQAGSLLGVSTTAMICLCYSSGFRKAEITTFDSRSTPLVFSSLVWHLQGTEYFGQPPFHLLRSPTDICCVAVYPRQSKCDFTAEIWGDKPSYHHFSPALGNAFCALAQLELMADIKGMDARRATPLYIDNERNPVSPSLANSILAALLLTFLTASQALCLTWHSFRIGLATRLHRAGISDADIQAICRWQSMESLKIYIKMTMEDYKDKLAKAHEQQGTVGSHPLCTIDSTTALGEAAGVGQAAVVADTLRQPLPPVLAADSARVASSGDDSDIEPSRPADLPAPQSLLASAPLARADVVAPTPPQSLPKASDLVPPTPLQPPPEASDLVPPSSPAVRPKLPPGWSEVRHTHNQKTGEPLAGRGFSTYHSPGGSLYRTIASSWETFRSRELSPHPNDHWPIISLGHDPDRCVLQNFVGRAPVEHAAHPRLRLASAVSSADGGSAIDGPASEA